jgi:hypothetical protein
LLLRLGARRLQSRHGRLLDGFAACPQNGANRVPLRKLGGFHETSHAERAAPNAASPARRPRAPATLAAVVSKEGNPHMVKLRPLLLAGALLTPGLAAAQAPAAEAPTTPAAVHPQMPPQPEKLPPPKWNPATVETLSGKLIGVWRSRRFGVVVGLDIGKEDVILLDVGPAYYVESKITFAAGDALEAHGSRVTFTNGKQGMLVATLKRGDLTVNIRNDKGKKLW